MSKRMTNTESQVQDKQYEKNVFNEEKRSKPTDWQSEKVFVKGFSWMI